MSNHRPPILPRLIVAAAIVASFAVLTLTSSCATAKDAAVSAGKDCRDQVTAQAIKDVTDASLAPTATDVEALLKSFGLCLGRELAQDAIAQLDTLDKTQAAPTPAASTARVSTTVGRDRLKKWLADHQGNIARIDVRLWRLLNGQPSPFISQPPQRSNC
jgi:hypothetical protein